MEEEKKEETKSVEELVEEMNEWLEKAQTADGFYVTICLRNKDRLDHYNVAVRVNPEDRLLHLNAVEKLVRKENPRTPLNITKMQPRRFA